MMLGRRAARCGKSLGFAFRPIDTRFRDTRGVRFLSAVPSPDQPQPETLHALPTPDLGGEASSAAADAAILAADASTLATDVAMEAVKVLGNWPSDYAIRGIDLVGSELGIPIGCAIVLTTVAIRLALFPISILSMKQTALMSKAKPDIELIQERMKADETSGSDPRKQSMYARQMQAVLTKYSLKPWLIFVFPLLQLPIFTSMFFGLQRIGDHVPATAQGGALWFTDLTVMDPYFVMPFACSALFLCMIELGADGMAAQGKSQQQMFKWVMRGLAVVMVPMTYSFPASVFCYWLTANSFSLAQTLMLNKVPGVREALGIPKLPPAPKPKADDGKEDLDFFAKVAKTLEVAKKAAAGEVAVKPPPIVSEEQFEKRTQEDHFLAARPHATTRTYAQRPRGRQVAKPATKK
ncbi:60Kd inner membrane protein-domain-containing protein [Pelagophyceae sp. CCMP2097]|nr:60Kd inner membrane protein-domain-containing protein [Pelagophyceae sp. CCMP2097]